MPIMPKKLLKSGSTPHPHKTKTRKKWEPCECPLMAETTPDTEKWQAIKQENTESDEQIPEQKITIQIENQAPKQRKKDS